MKDENQQRDQLTTLVARHVFGFNLLIGFILFLIAEVIIAILYGSEYYESAIALHFLIPGVVLTGMSRVLANDIAGRGKPEINTVHSAIALTFNIILNLLLIPQMGVRGAALASTISYASIAIMKVLAFTQLSGTLWYQVFVFTKDDIQLWHKVLIISKTRILNFLNLAP